MSHAETDPRTTLRPLVAVRQYREFTDEAVTPGELAALADVARWSGSSRNTQPWRFITLQDRSTIEAIANASLPQTRSLLTAPAALAIVVPTNAGGQLSYAYDEGRVAERILIGASMLGLGAGIAWVLPGSESVREMLGLPDDRRVRTIMAIGHPTDDERRARSAPGEARLPLREIVFSDRWRSVPAD